MLEDYELATSYFRQLAPLYAKDAWSDLELLTLELYAQCLLHIERKEDYVRMRLKILAKTSRRNAATGQQARINSVKPVNTRQPPQKASRSLSSIFSTSKRLKEQILLPMETYYDRIDLGIYVRHSSIDDSFQLPLSLGSLLPESFLAESVRVQILSVEEDQRSELWLHADNQKIEPGTSRIWLVSNVSQFCSTLNATIAHNAYRRCSQHGTS